MKTLPTLITVLLALAATPAIAAPTHGRGGAPSTWEGRDSQQTQPRFDRGETTRQKAGFVNRFGEALDLSPRQARRIESIQAQGRFEVAELKEDLARLEGKLARLQARPGPNRFLIRELEAEVAQKNGAIAGQRRATRAAIKEQLSSRQQAQLARLVEKTQGRKPSKNDNQGHGYGKNDNQGHGYGKNDNQGHGYGKNDNQGHGSGKNDNQGQGSSKNDNQGRGSSKNDNQGRGRR